MNNIMYLFQVSIITAVLYSIYRIFFSKNTFHDFNRYYLLLIILFSLICPVLEINGPISNQSLNLSVWINDFQEYVSIGSVDSQLDHAGNGLNIKQILYLFYLLGVAVFSLRFLRQFYTLIRLIASSEQIHKGNFTFVLTDKFNLPFSFFHWIFLSRESHNSHERNITIQHEKVHASQWHSIDLLLMEIFTIAFWFNPFVFLLKQSLKTTHEYIADYEVTNTNIKDEHYLRMLVSGTKVACLTGIANHFNYLTIKNRIEMITKNKTNRIKKLTYLIIVPVVATMIYAFSYNPYNEDNTPYLLPISKTDITKYSITHGIKMIDPFTNKERIHYGIDIVAAEGTEIIAAAGGMITYADFSEKGWGNLIIIRHDEQYETWYAHLKDIAVKSGDKIEAGQVIGYVGSTGKSTAPHLHFEVRKNGERVDPELYFKEE